MSNSWPRWISQVLLVRLRFPLIILGVIGLIAAWPWLRSYWDLLTHPRGEVENSISIDTEYWCPMCPGVVSEWPGKCPVCYMALVRRRKGEPAPLSDGVVARMQFSPYRVQLAGIRTTPAEFRALTWDTTLSGFVELGNEPAHVRVQVDVPESQVAFVRPGLPVDVFADALPGQIFAAHVYDVAPRVMPTARSVPIQLAVNDTRRELLAKMLVTARLRVPATHLDVVNRSVLDTWRDRTAVDLALGSLPAFAQPAPGLEALLSSSARAVLHRRDLVLAIPITAVIDTGERKVVFVERMPGMFDGIEVVLGHRCGDYYPVLRGLESGEAVVTSGAFLLDAETRLNPSLAAGYFGAAGRTARTGTSESGGSSDKLSAEDRQLIARQKLCPVTEEPLGSMGTPMRVIIDGRVVFLCCKGCEAEFRGHPKQYLAKLRDR